MKNNVDFKIFINKFNGIQSWMVVYDSNDEYHYVVNIFESFYNETKNEIPKVFNNKKIKIRKIY